MVDLHQGEAYGEFEVFVSGTGAVIPALLDHLVEWFEGV